MGTAWARAQVCRVLQESLALPLLRSLLITQNLSVQLRLDSHRYNKQSAYCVLALGGPWDADKPTCQQGSKTIKQTMQKQGNGT